MKDKSTRLFIVLSAFFLVNAVIAEFVGVKIFSLEDTLGISPFKFRFFGETITGFSLTCGVLLWPFVFVMTDIINEYFGKKGVRFISYIAAILIGYAYLMLSLGMKAAPAQWWLDTSNYGSSLNFDHAYKAVFGQGNNIIIGSLIAFLLSQMLDVTAFHWIKQKTGERYIWLRSTGSTVISQIIDSFVVLFYAFYVAKIGTPQQWSLPLILAVCTVNYIYKFMVAILMTPVIYFVHGAIEKYLGKEQAERLKNEAVKEE